MNRKVKVEATYPQSLAAVWRAITDPSLIARWFGPSDFLAVLGHRFRLKTDPKTGGNDIQCQVVEIKENRKLSFTWRDDENGQASLVTWSVEPVDGGTRMMIEHEFADEPEVTCLAIEAELHWALLSCTSLPLLLRLLMRRPRAPIVYVREDPPAPKRKRSRRREKVTR